jgi:hypothetical protein
LKKKLTLWRYGGLNIVYSTWFTNLRNPLDLNVNNDHDTMGDPCRECWCWYSQQETFLFCKFPVVLLRSALPAPFTPCGVMRSTVGLLYHVKLCKYCSMLTLFLLSGNRVCKGKRRWRTVGRSYNVFVR